MPIVFISYSHDSEAHRQLVLNLSAKLRSDGIETRLDRYINGTPIEGWPRWMLNQLDEANFVLVVCTEIYYRRFRGTEVPGKGKGADWESMMITQEIYGSRSATLKFVPVFVSSESDQFIPEPLRAATHYRLTSDSAYTDLYDFLLGQAGIEPPAVGTLKKKQRATGFSAAQVDTAGTEQHHIPVEISRILKYAPAQLIGRELETDTVNKAWAKIQANEPKRPHILTFIALGGEGKTSLIAKWLTDLAFENWPKCDAVFAWSFYSQGTREHSAVSSDLFLAEALTFFGDSAMARGPAGAFEKGRRLAQLVGDRRTLLILDGLEPMQYAPTSPTPGELKDQGIAALLRGLANINRGLCIVTSRYSLYDLRAYTDKTVEEKKLTRLSTMAGVALLQSFELRGSLRKNILSADGSIFLNEFEKIVEDVKGHALTINLIGSYLRNAHGGDLRRRDLIKLSEANVEQQGGHAFRVMDAYVESFTNEGQTGEDRLKGQRAVSLLRLVGLFDRPATVECLAALWRPEAITGLTESIVDLTEVQRNICLQRLEDAKLLTVNRSAATGELVSLDAHPLIREYFGQNLRNTQPDAWKMAHRRLYVQLCENTPDKSDATIEDLQPLYQAVTHGCFAGLHQEACSKVYYERIRRGAEHYAPNRLGAWASELGAIACFFEKPWSEVSSNLKEGDRAWLLSEAAHTLRSVGRLTESVDRSALKILVRQKDWGNAAIRAASLSETKLTLGDVEGALSDASLSVAYAKKSNDFGRIISSLAIEADALHQVGFRVKAESNFCKAEQMQIKHFSSHFLYSNNGFRYCDLLLAASERFAGQRYVGIQNSGKTTSCEAVLKRATKTLLQVDGDIRAPILTTALDHLTLGRASLYLMIFDTERGSSNRITGKPELNEVASRLEIALAQLRRAGSQSYLPYGLLTRAWLSSFSGLNTGLEGAQNDLDEAFEITERGPMPLSMADIYLSRARLFHREKHYPWGSIKTDLAKARSLISKHRYKRRLSELEDLEGVVGS